MEGANAEFRVALRPSKRRALSDSSEGKLQDLIEAANAHACAKLERPFRVIKQLFGFQKSRLRGLAKNRYTINVLAVLTSLFIARHRLVASGSMSKEMVCMNASIQAQISNGTS